MIWSDKKKIDYLFHCFYLYVVSPSKKIQAWSSYFFLALGADFSQAKIQAWFPYFSVPCFGSRFFSFFSLSFVSGKSKVMSLFKTTIVAEDIPQAVMSAGSNIHFFKFDSNFAIKNIFNIWSEIYGFKSAFLITVDKTTWN